jgi:hypothetical protein
LLIDISQFTNLHAFLRVCSPLEFLILCIDCSLNC